MELAGNYEYPLRLERQSYQELLMGWAFELARGRSTCQRYQVGCIIAPEDNSGIYSMGYNGNYAGGPNHCDDPAIKGGCGCLHAEDNAIAKLDRSSPNKVAYVTAAPCKACAKRLVNAGIKKVYYSEAYTYTEGIQILRDAGIPCIHLDLAELVIDDDDENDYDDD